MNRTVSPLLHVRGDGWILFIPTGDWCSVLIIVLTLEGTSVFTDLTYQRSGALTNDKPMGVVQVSGILPLPYGKNILPPWPRICALSHPTARDTCQSHLLNINRRLCMRERARRLYLHDRVNHYSRLHWRNVFYTTLPFAGRGRAQFDRRAAPRRSGL